MSTVTQAGSAPVRTDTLGIDTAGMFGAGDGPMATIDQLKAKLQKIFSEMRDLERAFNEAMQRIAYDRQVGVLETKEQAIMQNFDAAMASAVAQIVGGAVSAIGAASGSQLGASATDGLSKAGQGIAGVANASLTRDAQQTQLQGDFEGQSAERLQKALASTIERALDASRQMRDALRDLVTLQGQIAAAVRY
ncbi:pathogenicity island effector protein [Burkholderia oklahomensis]|uniref:pathogenicity island effector protein n=1 Tax=Burkholderia oklahomensis TaxID=342113 RepID=UPI0005EDB7FF|nr:pathogenicity island effector protein [Burkholderia oklahomensis]AOI48904.1 pathogenicity island effector protein [Burkholderia oklahomensis C6786]KUY50494.1 pathogenicity island effector protein [Burkholderia oklahomensis C6786]SUY26993.1 Secretion system effector D [Burkholderia oklahomensis]